jgi:hypothetical protein
MAKVVSVVKKVALHGKAVNASRSVLRDEAISLITPNWDCFNQTPTTKGITILCDYEGRD